MSRHGLVALIGVLLLGLLLASPALAESAGGESHEPDMFGRNLDLTIWTWVVFLLLLFVLSKYAWKPMMEGLSKREHTIHAALAEANRAREDAQRIQTQLQIQLGQAHEEVRKIVEEGRNDAQRLADEMMNKARAEIQTERDRLRREIDLAQDQALQQIWSQAAHLATLISTKVVRRQLSASDHRALVDEAIADLRQIGAV